MFASNSPPHVGNLFFLAEISHFPACRGTSNRNTNSDSDSDTNTNTNSRQQTAVHVCEGPNLHGEEQPRI